MKRKALMTTTALAFAGAMAAGSASAADMLSVGVHGYMEQWVGLTDRSDSADATVEGGVSQWSDSEIFFRGKLESDSGLTFSVKIELEGNSQALGKDKNGDTIDESQLTVGGSFGQIVLGTEDHPAALMHYGNQDVGVGYCGDSGWTGVTGCSRNGALGLARTAGSSAATSRRSPTTRPASAASRSAWPTFRTTPPRTRTASRAAMTWTAFRSPRTCSRTWARPALRSPPVTTR